MQQSREAVLAREACAQTLMARGQASEALHYYQVRSHKSPGIWQSPCGQLCLALKILAMYTWPCLLTFDTSWYAQKKDKVCHSRSLSCRTTLQHDNNVLESSGSTCCLWLLTSGVTYRSGGGLPTYVRSTSSEPREIVTLPRLYCPLL